MTRNGSCIDREILAYIHGRIEEKLINFADTFGINPLELTQNLGEIFVGAPVDRLPGVRAAARIDGTAVAAVEVADGVLRGPNTAWEKARRRRASKE